MTRQWMSTGTCEFAFCVSVCVCVCVCVYVRLRLRLYLRLHVCSEARDMKWSVTRDCILVTCLHVRVLFLNNSAT